MKAAWFLGAALGAAVLLGGCTSAQSQTPVSPSPPVADEVRTALDHLNEMSLSGLVAANSGEMFIVQDQAGALYRVDARGTTLLGEAPAAGLVAAWGPNDFGYAFVRKSDVGSGYEVVGVGHEGSKVLAQTVGYAGAMQFVGQEVHFIDAEGWKAVTWSGEPVVRGKLDLGPRANQEAFCVWTEAGPVCIGGYWNGSADSGENLTLVRAGEPAQIVMAKGQFPILASGAFAGDGRVLAANLGARSAGADERGEVVVARLDEAGTPEKVKEFKVLARELAFDAHGRLVATVFPKDGSGNGQIVFVNLEDGTTIPVPGAEIEGRFQLVMAPGGTKLYLLLDKGVREVALTAHK